MNNFTIQKGTWIQDTRDNCNYRILHMTEDVITIINMDTRFRLDIRIVSAKELMKLLQDEVLDIMENPEPKIIEVENLSENAQLTYKRNKLIVDIINNQYGPDYIGLMGKHKRPLFNEVLAKSGLTRKNLWRVIIKYLQSGMQESSLLKSYVPPVPKDTVTSAKRGKRSSIEDGYGKNLEAVDYANMATYLKRYLSNEKLTIKKSHDDMISECYTKPKFNGESYQMVELPSNQIPSLAQFYYYINQHTTRQQRQSAKLGKREYRNSKRLLTGTAMNGVSGPGDIFEIDACELDIAVVSATDRKAAVGSPVVYFMIDVYSRLITAASLSFDNNSILAMTNCLSSLVEDKQALLDSMGIRFEKPRSIPNLDWVMPSGIKPHVIRMDHGSDFISKQSQLIANELNIELQYVPPGTGSLKGVVERSFRSFQEYFRDMTEKAGVKENKGISKHNREAKLTIDEVKKLLYHFILSHNTSVHQGYTLTPDMVAKKVGSVPAEIWHYGVEHAGNPAYITDRNQFLYSLLVPEKAKLKRSGILYKGLRYIPDFNQDPGISHAMIAANAGSVPFNIRIDLRSCAQVYYLNKAGQLCVAKIVDDVNHQEVAKLSWPAFNKLVTEARRLDKEKQLEADKTRRALRRASQDVVADAKVASGKGRTDDKNMRLTRAIEKNRVAQELSFDKRFALAEPAKNQIEEATKWLDEPTREQDTDSDLPWSMESEEETLPEPEILPEPEKPKAKPKAKPPKVEEVKPEPDPVEHQNPSETPTNPDVITQDYVDDNERRRQEVVAMTIQAFEEDEEDDY